MKRYVIRLLFILFFLKLQGQQKFDLKGCINYGLENHPSIQIYKNKNTAAHSAVKEALSSYLPSITLNTSLDDNLKVQEQLIPAGVFGDKDIRVAFTKKFNASSAVQLDQTIYDQSLLIGLKARKYKKQEAVLNEQQNQEQLIYNISVAFYQVKVYSQQLEYLKQNKEAYGEQVRISELQVTKGILAEVELNKIRVNYNNIFSQLRVAESNLDYSINDLKNNIGFPMDQILIVETENKTPQKLIDKIPGDVVFNPADRLDYQLANLNKELLKIDYQSTKATNFPKLSAYARYGGVSFGDQLNEVYSSVQVFSAIGIKMSAPLFDGFKRISKSKQAKMEYLNAIENLKLDQSKFRMEVENAKTKSVKAQSSISNDLENVQLAESVFKTKNLQYQKGVASLTEWLDAQSSLKEAQNNYLKSIVDYYLSSLDLEKASGTLKQYYNSLN